MHDNFLWNHTALILFFQILSHIGCLRLLPFLAAGVACYLLCRAFLRVPRSIPALVGLAAGLTAAVSILLLWKCSDLSGFWWSVFSVTAVASVVVCNIMNCTEPPAAAKSISAMELTTSFFVVFLWVQTVSGMDAVYRRRKNNIRRHFKRSVP